MRGFKRKTLSSCIYIIFINVQMCLLNWIQKINVFIGHKLYFTIQNKY